MHSMHPTTRLRGVMLIAAGAVIAGGVTVAANAGGYPIKCVNNTAITVDHATGAQQPFPTIQQAVDAAQGDAAGSSVGDTVVVCHGTFVENVTIGSTGDDKANVTVRSFDGSDQAKVVAANPDLPVFTINSNGVVLGGPGLGLYLTGGRTGIQVGLPAPIDLTQSDDQPIPCPEIEPTIPPTCDDKEMDPATPINVSVIGNRIRDLTAASGVVTGIAVNNSNNTLVYRNLVERASVGAGGVVYGIRYSDTNANNHVLQNAVHQLSEFGGCDGSTSEDPTVGVVGVSIEDEALDALVHDTLVDNLTSDCAAVGIYSDAWGGLENDRNGQQIPIATDLVGNRVTKISGGAAPNQEAAVSIAPVAPQNDPMGGDTDDTNPPSSFRVLSNDLQDATVSVAVWTQLAMYSYIEENDFDHDTVGVFNNGDDNLDATNNWWGCQEGPASGKKECATIGGAGTTFYNPWLRSHVDHAGEHAGEWAGHG